MKNWKKLLATVAPGIATALGGPLAGVAVQAIGKAVLGKESVTEAELDAALSTATPETLLALKNAEQAFQTQMVELEIDLERVHADDRASAREREAKTGDVWTPRALASVVVAGFFACVGYVLAGKVEVTGEAGVLIGTLIGYVSAKADQVVSYYFGSSAGSKDKTVALAAAGRR